MSKQDRQGVRTAADLERKYDFGSLGKGGSGESLQISKLEQNFSQFKIDTIRKLDELEKSLKEFVAPSADDVTYDNTSSSLTAKNVRSAIDELDELVETNKEDIELLKENGGSGGGGIYIGSGEMPDGYNVQIDPNGEADDDNFVTRKEFEGKSVSSVYFEKITTTSEGSTNKLFKVKGNGYVLVSSSLKTDSTTDTGTVYIYLYKNDADFAFSGNRLASASNVTIGCNACGFVEVTDGDIIKISAVHTKIGTKALHFNFMCFGECTVEKA